VPTPFRPREQVIALVVRVLAPEVGEHMAAAAVRAHLEHTDERLSDAQVDKLVEKLAKGLVVFVGRQVSQRVVAELRVALKSGETR